MHLDKADSLFDKWENFSWGTRLLMGLSVFLAVRIVLSFIFDLSPLCFSGWKSPSIGSQGACSHNGGVDHSASENAFAFSLIAAMLFSFAPDILLGVARRSSESRSIRAEVKEVVGRTKSTLPDLMHEDHVEQLENMALLRPEMTAKGEQEMLHENEMRAEASRQYILQELEKSRRYNLNEKNRKSNRNR